MLEVKPSSNSILWADRKDSLADLPPLPRWLNNEEDDVTSGDTRGPFEVSKGTSALLKNLSPPHFPMWRGIN